MPKTCWARALGDCVEKINKEHYITASIWTEDAELRISGLHWCKDRPEPVGLASLASHILCEKHNGALSTLDQAAKDAFAALRGYAAYANTLKGKHRLPAVRRFEIDGPLLERWLLKTAINLATLQKIPSTWQLDGSPAEAPGQRMLDLVFGAATIDPPLGMYLAVEVGANLYTDERVEAAPLLDSNDSLVGFDFIIRGLPIVLWLADHPPPETVTAKWFGSKYREPRRLMRHMAYMKSDSLIESTGATKTTHYLQIRWLNSKAPAWVYRLR